MFDKLKGNSPSSNDAPAQPRPAPSPAPSFSTESPGSRSSSSETGNILSKDVSITGKIKLTGDISIDGNVDGEITTKGVVTINQNAVIKAIIKAGTIVVHGKIQGNLEATDRIELLRTSEIVGDIKAAVLKVDAGAVFVGSSEIGKTSLNSSKPVAAPEKKVASAPTANPAQA